MATDVRKDIPDNYKYGWYDADAKYQNVKKRGLDEAVIREISQTYKKEPQWMLQFRLRALDIFRKKPIPKWRTRANARFAFCSPVERSAACSGIDSQPGDHVVRHVPKDAIGR